MRDGQNRNMYGVFEPSDVDEMRKELKLGDVPGESLASREQRAAAIIQRRMDHKSSSRLSTVKNPASADGCG